MKSHRLRPDRAVLSGVLELGQPRQAGDAQAELASLLKQPSLGGIVEQGGIGQDEALQAYALPGEAGHGIGQIGKPAENGRAVDLAPLKGGGIVQDADHPIRRVPVAAACADEQLGSIAGAHEQHRNRSPADAMPSLRDIAQQPIGEPGATEAHDQQTPLDERDRARNLLQPGEEEHQWEREQDDESRALGDVEQVVH